MPVTKQPTQQQWAAIKPANQQARPGLEHLATMSKIHLKQKIDMLEVLTGWQVKNKFRITDPDTGHIIGLFKEDSECCQRQCCKNARSFKADIVGENDRVLFKIDRPLACQCSCCPNACDGCCGQSMEVFDSQGQKILDIHQIQSCHILCCLIDFGLDIVDVQGNFRFRVANNVCKATCCENFSDGCCTDKYLHIYDSGDRKVGRVIKKWRGCATECCTPADSLLIEFPESATPEDKAGIISATLLADYNIWEQQNNQQ